MSRVQASHDPPRGKRKVSVQSGRLCKKCGGPNPCRQLIGGVLKLLPRRKFCTTCSPFGAHNTRDIARIGPRPPGAGRCGTCRKRFVVIRSKGHRGTICGFCKTNRIRQDKKRRAVEFLGGKCQGCGYCKIIEVLDFHHVDRSTKLASLSQMWNHSWKRVVEELKKCRLLCANCHREEEVVLRDARRCEAALAA